jgi:hypothetical protein
MYLGETRISSDSPITIDSITAETPDSAIPNAKAIKEVLKIGEF